jgi:hypothetical protein
MKKNYVKPEGNVVALQMNENIALSFGFADYIINFTLAYRVEGDTKYIQDTNIVSKGKDGIVGATLDLFLLVDAIVDGFEGLGPVIPEASYRSCNANA